MLGESGGEFGLLGGSEQVEGGERGEIFVAFGVHRRFAS
jgi:hypothetical protein